MVREDAPARSYDLKTSVSWSKTWLRESDSWNLTKIRQRQAQRSWTSKPVAGRGPAGSGPYILALDLLMVVLRSVLLAGLLRPFALASQTDQQGRAVYRIDPRMDGKELRLDPRPINRTDRTGSSLSRTTRQSQTDGQARSNLGRAEQGTGRDFSLLAHLEHTGHMDELIDQFDQFMHFDHLNLSKAQILHLSEDLGRLWSKMARKTDKSVQTDQPATVLILTAVQPA
ncbi:hypothetical protein DY000_02048258 [Brassica cretica]|uniref:Uncharacterized protein n=1 Tax=Brassica cretica TaxID=69181 RepID=A0ABQ7EWR5_BRACR|nr:hypothetical protein DY000_02048258 [Brassica cretica]